MVAELADEGDEKLMQLLTHVRDWNTHSRSCRVAQVTHAPPSPPHSHGDATRNRDGQRTLPLMITFSMSAPMKIHSY